MKRNRGFTLIELMVASVLLAITLGGLGSSFSMGLKLWKRVNFNRVEEKVAIALSDMIRRAEEGRHCALFKLDSDSINAFSFVGIVRSDTGPSRLGELHYWIDGEGRLLRRERTYSEFLSKSEGRITELAEDCEALRVGKLYFNPLGGVYQSSPVMGKLQKERTPEPDALQILLDFKTPDGEKHTLERLVRLAVSPDLETAK